MRVVRACHLTQMLGDQIILWRNLENYRIGYRIPSLASVRDMVRHVTLIIEHCAEVWLLATKVQPTHAAERTVFEDPNEGSS